MVTHLRVSINIFNIIAMEGQLKMEWPFEKAFITSLFVVVHSENSVF